MQKEELIDLLNGLIDTCKDSQKGFLEAMDIIETPQQQVFFGEYSRLRKKFATTLQGQVRILGGEPDRRGSFAGALHREWINFRTTMHAGDQAIFGECLRGEEAALKNYEAALKRELPSDVRAMLEQQRTEIKETCDRIRVLCSSK